MGILEMFNANLVLRVRVIVYAVLIFFSFFIFVGVAVMKDSVKFYSCPLYCERTLVRSVYIIHSCSGVSNCNFPMAIAIMFQLLYLLFRIASLLLLLLGKFSTDFVLYGNIPELIYVAVDLLAFFFTFIGACILSAGTNSTCGDSICERGTFADALSASRAAQAGAWISTFAWLFVGVLGFLYLIREGKIPFLGGSAPATSSGTGAEPNAPTQDTPPYNPDEPPKY